MKKFDCHMHLIENIHGLGSKGILRDLGDGRGQYENGEIIRLIPEEYGNKITPELLIDLMDKHDVSHGVLLQGHYAGIQNIYTYEATLKYPNRLLGSAMYDPFFRKSNEIRNHLFIDLKFKIIKMELSNTSGLMCNHEPFDLNGDMMNEIYDFAQKLGLIFYLDIGRPGNVCYQVKSLKEAILKHPNITFIICHLTAPQHDNKDILINNMKMLKFPNVYFDIASLYNNVKDPYPFYETQDYLRCAIDIVGNDKILWGSDFPSAMNKYDYEKSYKYIEESNILNNEEKENILFNNAMRVFKDLI